MTAWLAVCRQLGLPRIIILETGRTRKRARWLWGFGRDWPGPKRTWTLESPHITGDAFDFAVLDERGMIDWKNKAAYEAVGRVAESLGLQWGEKPGDGDVDLGHIQLRHPEEQPVHG